jgi:hypothetical protein
MSKSSRAKGGRIERELVNMHKDIGCHAERVPLSGAAGGSFSGDIDVYPFGRESGPLVGEVKARGDGGGFKTIARWLGQNDFLALRQDHAKPVIVLPWRTWERMVKALRGPA